MKKHLLIFIIVATTFQLFAQPSVPQNIILGNTGDNGSISSGWTDFKVVISEDVQVIFEWDILQTDVDGLGYDFLRGVKNNDIIDLGEEGPDTISLQSGDTFGFRFETIDNSAGANFYKIHNFSPGFSGQFHPNNWSLSHNNSDGTAYFQNESPIATNSETCSSLPKRNNFEWIESIKVGDVSFGSGKNENAYGDYTETPLVIQPSEVLEIELTPGYKNRNYTEYWRIWIDINNDGDYSDEGEMVFEAKGKGMVEGDIPFPDGLVSPNVRVKVAMSWKNYPPYCGSFNSGEVEEYTWQLAIP